MKRFQKILRSIGIRQRMQFGFLLLPLLMMLIVLFVYYQMSSDMILEKKCERFITVTGNCTSSLIS